jgi:hypothetical protein
MAVSKSTQRKSTPAAKAAREPEAPSENPRTLARRRASPRRWS